MSVSAGKRPRSKAPVFPLRAAFSRKSKESFDETVNLTREIFVVCNSILGCKDAQVGHCFTHECICEESQLESALKHKLGAALLCSPSHTVFEWFCIAHYAAGSQMF